MPDPSDMPVLEFLRRQLDRSGLPEDRTHLRYPTAISQLLGFEITAVGLGTATLAVDVDAIVHGNQQGTVHGGFLAELGDAAIGTAHSTLMGPGESFTSIDLRATFLRPVWHDRLLAHARPAHSGRDHRPLPVRHHPEQRRQDGRHGHQHRDDLARGSSRGTLRRHCARPAQKAL